MSGSRPIRDIFGWIVHRLTANYWSLALVAVVSAPLVFAASLHLDRNGGTAWLLARDLAPAASPETARDAAAMIAGIDAQNEGSYNFHLGLGFTPVAHFKEVGFKFDKWLDLTFMQLMLPS